MNPFIIIDIIIVNKIVIRIYENTVLPMITPVKSEELLKSACFSLLINL